MAGWAEQAETPDSGNTPNASGSFTPTAGDLLIFVVGTAASVTDADDVPTASANGITFSAVGTGGVHSIFNTSTYSLDLFVADQLVPVGPSAMTITWGPTDPGTSTIIGVYSVTGMARAGTSAIRQVDNTDNGAATGTPACTFPVAALTGNVVIGAVANLSAPAGVTEPGSFTETTDTNCTTPTVGLEVAYRLSGHTSDTVTWGGTSATAFGAVAVELDTSVPEDPRPTRITVGPPAALHQAANW